MFQAAFVLNSFNTSGCIYSMGINSFTSKCVTFISVSSVTGVIRRILVHLFGLICLEQKTILTLRYDSSNITPSKIHSIEQQIRQFSSVHIINKKETKKRYSGRQC